MEKQIPSVGAMLECEDIYGEKSWWIVAGIQNEELVLKHYNEPFQTRFTFKAYLGATNWSAV